MVQKFFGESVAQSRRLRFTPSLSILWVDHFQTQEVMSGVRQISEAGLAFLCALEQNAARGFQNAQCRLPDVIGTSSFASEQAAVVMRLNRRSARAKLAFLLWINSAHRTAHGQYLSK